MKKNQSSDSLVWFEIKARYEFFWILVLLLGCGYLSSPNLIIYFFMLLFLGINSVNTSLYNLSLEKIKSLSESDDSSLEEEIAKIRKASEILARHRDKLKTEGNHISSDKLRTLQGVIRQSLDEANCISQARANERLRSGYQSGSPPIEYSDGLILCPACYPIRATKKLKRYYLPNERDGMQSIHWCFPTTEAAEREGFTRPKGDRKQPEVQPRPSRKKK
jgi:hypothetical protein